jgi:phage terminase large subunit-like protein
MPMYDTTHKLHKGIDNALRFKFRDTDRKSIDLTNKTVIWKMYDRESRENVLFRYLTVTNASKGMAKLDIPTSDTVMLPEGFYQYAMYTVEDGVEQIVYTDTNDNAHGTIEVIDDVYPEFEDSQISATFFDDGTKWCSAVFDGSGSTIKSKSIHTIALYFTGFTGVIKIEGDLSPSSSPSDDSVWFDLTPRLMYDSSITISSETGVQGYVVQANVNWLRVSWPNTATGTIDKILVRN